MNTPQSWAWITEPTLLLNTAIAKENIKRMVDKAKHLNVGFRPHFKTHQAVQIGEWFRALGVQAITVSSIEMATYFADAGWKDITIAFPINVRAIAAINDLASRIRLGVLISDVTAVPILEKALTSKVYAWIEVDTGDGRSGFDWNAASKIEATVRTIQATHFLKFEGLLGHAGYTYRSKGHEQIGFAHKNDLERLLASKKSLEAAGLGEFLTSTGDTPSCSIETNFEGVDEIRPGNFVFYDIQQQQIGSCGYENIAVALACPVVAVYPERAEIVVHAGGVHLAKDSLVDGAYGQIFGRIVLPREDGWEMPEMGCYVRSISQEHGTVVVRRDLVQSISVGDVLAILPVHSCMTADLMGYLWPIDIAQNTTPITMMKVERKPPRV